jgi:type I restriction enzyme S subunit
MTKAGKKTADFAEDADMKKKSAPSALSAVNSPAPTGRNMPAQGNALGHTSQNTSNPEPERSGDRPPTGGPEGVTEGNQRAKQGAPARYQVALDRVARHHSGNSKLIKGKLHDAPADNLFPAFSATGQDVWRDAFDREGDAIIISAVGARCGKCFLARGRWSAIANTHVVWPDPEKADIKFLWYLLNDEQFWIRSGSAQPFVAVRKTFEKEIFVPPLPEQRRIVAEIEKQFTRLEAGVAALRRVQANLKRYRAAVLKAACEGRLVPTEAALARSPRSTKNGPPAYETGAALLARILTERRQNWQGRGQYKEPAAPAAAKLGPLPEGWTWATFEQIAERVTVGFVGSMKHEYVENGVPFLRGQNVRENRFDPEGLLCVSPEFHQKLSKSALRPGDLAVVRSGSVGVTCVIPDSLPDANCSDLVLIQRPLGFVPRYGAYYMNSLAKRHVAAGKVGVALIHFNTKSVAALAVPLPPLAEQTRIVAEVERRLSVVEELESVVTANLQRATRLRQSILQKAFSGAL